MFLLSLYIVLNQAGFYPDAPKVAVVTNAPAASKFYVINADKKDTVFFADLGEEKQSGNSDTKTRIADFTKLTTKGNFFIHVPGVGNSYIFKISDDANREVAIATLKGFYYQRVSMPLEEKYAGKWHRPAGHPDTAVYIHPSAADEKRPAGTIISSPGGWYDAGDYNKYIVNSGITMGTLLSAYEDFPVYFSKFHTNIPESNNTIPDILDEMIYNLRWMLSMQDPNDGGVYNKCTNASFDGMVMPGVTKAPRYVVQKGTAAALDFAAVTAQASRVLKQYNKGLADTCLKAAERAWEWAKLHPAMEYDQKNFQPPVTTGPYGDKYFKDEWFWAGAELYVTTKQEQYKPEIIEAGLPSWSNVGMLGYYTLLRFNAAPQLKEKVIRMADRYAENLSAFQTPMGQSVRDFNWGSNSNAANQGILLINAYKLTGDKKYIDLALSNLDYLLGRNATGYCFVTGIGSKSPMHPHHRPSEADGIKEPVPGLLAGGPNPGMQDKCKYEFTAPELAYADIECSYASNEIAINWNAPIVYLANALEALKHRVGYTQPKK
ncbi:glycoside hydrolase family 9 protein [Chitinophaga niabensis]|uniref:glycoside hydrolase family 9 protein n=1 Tax=Chitinophaga niabensis TaxID=536979 RepID=UPI0031BAFCCF